MSEPVENTEDLTGDTSTAAEKDNVSLQKTTSIGLGKSTLI